MARPGSSAFTLDGFSERIGGELVAARGRSIAWPILCAILLTSSQAIVSLRLAPEPDYPVLFASACMAVAAVLASIMWLGAAKFLTWCTLALGAILIWIGLVLVSALSFETSVGVSVYWFIAICSALVVQALRIAGRPAMAVLSVLLPAVVLSLVVAGFYSVRALPTALIRDPNVMADVVIILQVFTVGHLLSLHARRNVSPAFRWAFVLVVFFTLLIHFGFASRLGLLISSAVLLILVLPLRSRLLVILPLIPLSAFVLSTFGVGPGVEGGSAALTSGATSSGAARLHLWAAAVELAKGVPVLGLGFMAFGLVFPAIRPAYLEGAGNWMVHNDYLQFWVEAGAPFALFWSVAACVVGIAVLSDLRRAMSRPAGRESGGGLRTLARVALLVLMVHGAANFPFYDPNVLSLLLALCVLSLPDLGLTPAVRRTGRAVVLSLILPASLAGLFVLKALGGFALGQAMVGRPTALPLVSAELTASQQFERSLWLAERFPEWSRSHYFLAHAGAAVLDSHAADSAPSTLIDFTSEAFETAIEINPWVERYYLDYGKMLARFETRPLEYRVDLYRSALAKRPQSSPIWEAYAFDVLEHRGLAAGRDVAGEWVDSCSYGARRSATASLRLLALVGSARAPAVSEAEFAECLRAATAAAQRGSSTS